MDEPTKCPDCGAIMKPMAGLGYPVDRYEHETGGSICKGRQLAAANEGRKKAEARAERLRVVQMAAEILDEGAAESTDDAGGRFATVDPDDLKGLRVALAALSESDLKGETP